MSDRSAIVIPIYNQERYLDRALDSLASQTSHSFVAICVDDGSTDASAAILERRCQSETFEMRIVRQRNAGVSAARNRGIEEALALDGIDSVMFLDPDDWYLPTCVEQARRAHASEPGAVVEWGFSTHDRPLSGFSTPGRLEPSVCCKLYPCSVVADVRFCEQTNVAEDLTFNLEVVHRHRPSILRINEPLYFYESNDESTMHRPLTRQDFVRRSAVIERILSIPREDEEDVRDRLCREECLELLKQFWRDLRRVSADERTAAGAVFRDEIISLRRRGLLRPNWKHPKDLKYYLRFLFTR